RVHLDEAGVAADVHQYEREPFDFHADILNPDRICVDAAWWVLSANPAKNAGQAAHSGARRTALVTAHASAPERAPVAATRSRLASPSTQVRSVIGWPW